MTDNYILPNTNLGVLYPSWVASNYKKYKVEKTPFDPNDDLCSKVDKSKGEIVARPYQKFLQKYLRYESPFRSILIYHGLGVGKTATSIYIYNILFNKTSNWNVFILVKKSLIKGWMDELNTFLEKENLTERMNNIHFINYDSSNAHIKFKEAHLEKNNIGKNNFYIIDEAHNFIRNVYSNIASQHSVRALEPYEHIKREIKNNKNSRLVCISGTPVINKPYELALLFNLLRKNSFPDKEDEFNSIFLKNEYAKEINPITKNLFQRRILGLISYYEYYHKGLYASKEEKQIQIDMSVYQEKVYDYFEAIEEKLEKKKSKVKKSSSSNNEMFKAYTRQACNFVFPYISKEINGENRPRPNIFRKTLKGLENTVHSIEHNLIKNTDKETTSAIKLYKNASTKFINELEKLWNSLKDKDLKKNISISSLLKSIKKDLNFDIKNFIKENIKKSELLRSMHDCSAKILYMCINLYINEGNSLIYTNYVNMEGIQIIKVYFKYFSYNKLGEYHGGIVDKDIREKTRSTFNNSNNKNGENMNIIIISPAMTEGVNLSNVKQVHILEPHWNNIRIQQVIGRAIRQCSHKDLPMKERHVIIYRYFMSRENKKITTDQKINEIASKKFVLLNSFMDAMKESAVDCELFKNVNYDSNKPYSCFKFSVDDQLSSELGYAFHKNIYDDNIKENKGLNSIYYEKKILKTVEINAVKQLGSSVTKYWYDENTGYVFDYDVDILIGRIKKDKYNIPEMKDINTYIIGELSELDKYKLSSDLL
jgi:superfamily II DNA or RNA helicase